ncbi:hypothetical protein PIB30_097816, partial [Stylosanthes scabra]|nr:hypothetical protein [Stylosanthes scabra]
MRGRSSSSRSESRLRIFKRGLLFPKLHSSTHRRRRSKHMRGKHLGNKQLHKTHAYAWKAHSSHVPKSRLAKPKRDQDFSKPKSATHRHRSPRICVGSHQLMFEAHVGRAK